MEIKDLRKKDKKELAKMLATDRAKLRELRFSNSNKQLKNIRQIRALRKQIAQLLTVINEFRTQE
jgi:ribosomal protein L29